MSKSDKRVILIPGDKSKWFDQAIFIVRKGTPDSALPVDFVRTAEAIVSNYLRTGERHREDAAKEYAVTASAVALDAAPIEAEREWIEVTPRPTAQKTGKKKGTAGVDLALNVIMLVCCVALATLIAMAIAS